MPVPSLNEGFHPAPAQHEALWLSPDGGEFQTGHNLLWTLRISGPLDPDRLAGALTAVTIRHDALRAVFKWSGNGLEWRITPPVPVSILRPQLSFDPTGFGLARYDLQNGPLYRFALLSSGPEEHSLLCAFSHLVMDGTSWIIFAKELAAHLAHGGFQDADARPKAALSVAQDQERWLQSPEADQARERARRDLSGMISPWQVSPLPTERSDDPDRQGQIWIMDLPDSLSTKLRSRANQMGTTPFRLAMTVFALLLGRLARREDVLLKTTLVGREAIGSSAPIGFFVTQSILSLYADPATGFDQFAATVRAAVDEAQRQQHLPLRLAALAAGLPPSLTRQGITDASFTRRPDRLALVSGDMTFSDEWHELQQLDAAIAVQMQDRGAVFRFVWRGHAKAVFGTLQGLAQRYQALLSEALANPPQVLGDLVGISPEDRSVQLGPLNATDVDFPQMAPLHDMFVRQAERDPERTAVVAGERKFSYGAILTAAFRLAHQLTEMGVGPGQIVPVKMHPSPEMLVSELATLLTGAAFAPLSPDWPTQRVKALCDRLGSATVLVCEAPGPGELSVAAVFQADDHAPRPTPRGGIDEPIYLVFTSGSTGTPKGAINLHRGVVNRLLAMDHAFGTSGQDKVLATAPGTVDTHVWQFFWPLINGGTVVMPTRLEAVSPPDLVRLIEHHAVTVADFVPSIFADLVPEVVASKRDLSNLRLVLIGGEAIRPLDVHAFRSVLPSVVVVNSYGPTETSIGAIHHLVQADESPIPIGRPYANVRAIVMDGQHLAPLGSVGELCLGGACLGRGYLNDQQATDRAFIANPFPELQTDRLYRTGDLVRMHLDGKIDYLGRVDHQIKTRGQRVEPAEVEAALLRQPGVAAALVFAENGQTLCALLVPKDGEQPLESRKLRTGLAALLPIHMIPARFATVSALPLAPSGKVDRQAAGTCRAQVLSDIRSDHKPPQTLTERTLADLWSKELGLDQIGRDEDIFDDLASDSLQAMRLLLVAAQIAGRELAVSSLFRNSTLASFATVIDDAQANDAVRKSLLDGQRDFLRTWTGEKRRPDSLLRANNVGGRRLPLFWCCQGNGEMAALATYLGPDRPVFGMRSGHQLMEYTPENIGLLAKAYADEMLDLHREGEFVLGGNCQAIAIVRSTAEYLRQAGRTVALLIMLEETNFTRCREPTLLLFGKESHLNPFLSEDPMPKIVEAFGKDVMVDFVPGKHGQLFTSELGACIMRHLLRVEVAGRPRYSVPASALS